MADIPLPPHATPAIKESIVKAADRFFANADAFDGTLDGVVHTDAERAYARKVIARGNAGGEQTSVSSAEGSLAESVLSTPDKGNRSFKVPTHEQIVASVDRTRSGGLINEMVATYHALADDPVALAGVKPAGKRQL